MKVENVLKLGPVKITYSEHSRIKATVAVKVNGHKLLFALKEDKRGE